MNASAKGTISGLIIGAVFNLAATGIAVSFGADAESASRFGAAIISIVGLASIGVLSLSGKSEFGVSFGAMVVAGASFAAVPFNL